MRGAGKNGRPIACGAWLASAVLAAGATATASPLVPARADRPDLVGAGQLVTIPRPLDPASAGAPVAPAVPSSAVTLPGPDWTRTAPGPHPIPAADPAAPSRFPIPEPASLVLLTTGLIGLTFRRHLLRRKIS